jgi:hypothetical protein
MRSRAASPSHSCHSFSTIYHFSISVEVACRLYTRPLARYTYLPHYTKGRASVEAVQSQVVSEARRSQELVLGRDSPIPAP